MNIKIWVFIYSFLLSLPFWQSVLQPRIWYSGSVLTSKEVRLYLRSLGFLCAALFALMTEPNGRERWVSAIPFFAIIFACFAQGYKPLSSVLQKDSTRKLLIAVILLFFVGNTTPGKLIVYRFFERGVITRPLLQNINDRYDQRFNVIFSDDFKKLSIFRSAKACYTWETSSTLQCWDASGRSELEVEAIPDQLPAVIERLTYERLFTQSDFPHTTIDVDRLCDNSWFGRSILGDIACIDVVIIQPKLDFVR